MTIGPEDRFWVYRPDKRSWRNGNGSVLSCKSARTAYRLNGFISEGTYGSIYSAVRLNDQTKVAIKVSKEKFCLARANCDHSDFVREYMVHKIISERLGPEQSVVVKMLDSFLLEVRPNVGTVPRKYGCTVLELMEGSLSDMFDTKSTATAKRWREATKFLCRALTILHSHNIFHLDVKAGNVLYDSDGNFKLADMGLSCVLGVMNCRATGTYIPKCWSRGDGLPTYKKVTDPKELKAAEVFSTASTLNKLYKRISGDVNDKDEELEEVIKKVLGGDDEIKLDDLLNL